MRKFFILVKKEIQELLTPQMLVPLLVIVLVFVFVGRVVGNEAKKTAAVQPIEVLDLDNSATSKSIIEILEKSNLKVNVSFDKKIDEVVNEAKKKNEKAALVIPKGFEEGLNNFSQQKIEVYSVLKNFSFTGIRSSAVLQSAIALINENISGKMLSRATDKANPAALKQPIKTNDFVIIGNKQANISPTAVSGFISSQTVFIPMILFLVIILASQLIASSIASEKENKTLETLLSSPISRKSVVSAKLLAAGLVALLTAAVYLFGMRYYMAGLMGPTGANSSPAIKEAIVQLGLTFSTADYLMLGLSLFFGILAALAIAMILGSFAEDAKAAQGVITPLMVLVLVPYFLTMFLDVSSLSPGLKILVYAIPFSHPFLAAPNLLLNQYQNVWYGIFYMAVLFVIFVFIAAKIFSSDKIFTMKLNFRKRK